ncbi:hypothetical protein U91I_01015 [alpha proteobacterium U9-1i]|nr:hypothetical protein U91I_01015 [alpha proteobacterium U9-1i]
MKVFDEIERTSLEGPSSDRSEFAFLNATAIPEAAQMRALIESAFVSYGGDKPALRQRLRSLDNTAHLGAVFELLLHELARRRGLGPQADAPLGAGLPDQRIELGDNAHAFVECRMLKPGNLKLYDILCDAIDAVQIPSLLYYVRLRKTPGRSLPVKLLQRDLRQQMMTLDIAALSTKALENKHHAFAIKDGDDLVLQVIPYRKPGSKGGVGMMDGAPNDFATSEELRRGLERKNRKYADAGAPYIIAICSAKSYAHDEEVEEALFREGSGEQRGFFIRSPRANVSAVLACQRWKPSSFAPSLKLYLNPSATHPLSSNPFGCEAVEYTNGALVRTAGQSFQALMRLPL